MRVLFAPDYRAGSPYQQLLAEALTRAGVKILFPNGYRRGLPLARATREADVEAVHLHWPEAYFRNTGALAHALRKLRFPLDLRLAAHRRPLFLTAHNLWPHHQSHDALLARAVRFAYRRADAVFAHSSAAAELIATTFKIARDRLHVIPHGDLAPSLPPPVSRNEARARLGYSHDGPMCLFFGALAPYKGIEEIVDFWRREPTPVRLVLAGQPATPRFEAELRDRIAGHANLHAEFGFLSPARLANWLSAADCAVFNYRRILTSGGAALARSWGLPVLIPAACSTVDLMEPDPRVARFANFDATFAATLRGAAALGRDFEAAARWREFCDWDRVAGLTKAAYVATIDPHARANSS
jgi:glycosyltransferase involved in cell wall biosynthesis